MRVTLTAADLFIVVLVSAAVSIVVLALTGNL